MVWPSLGLILLPKNPSEKDTYGYGLAFVFAYVTGLLAICWLATCTGGFFVLIACVAVGASLMATEECRLLYFAGVWGVGAGGSA